MESKRIILELGTGNDLYGENYTKAACRAVQDALHHSSLIIFRSLPLDRHAMQVTVNVGVQKPELIDRDVVAAEIPYGDVTVVPVVGGLNVVDDVHDTVSVIATAGIAVHLELPDKLVLPAG
ncbi:MAG: Lin0512 family protein [Pseudomonadota bacterium]